VYGELIKLRGQNWNW